MGSVPKDGDYILFKYDRQKALNAIGNSMASSFGDVLSICSFGIDTFGQNHHQTHTNIMQKAEKIFQG